MVHSLLLLLFVTNKVAYNLHLKLALFVALQSVDVNLFTMMTQNLTEEQKHGVQSVINHGITKQQKLGKHKQSHSLCFEMTVTLL